MKDVMIERIERLERECHRLRRQAFRGKLAGSLALIGVVVLKIVDNKGGKVIFQTPKP